MFRKLSLLALASVLVAGSLTAIPANGATKVSNGVSCKKAGATTKSGGATYRCARNPLVKNSKLTWLSTDCLSLSFAYNRSRNSLPAAKAKTEAAVAKLDADIANWKIEVAKAAVDIADYQAKIVLIKDANAKLKADTANLSVNAVQIQKFDTAVRNFETAIRGKSIFARNLTRAEADKRNASLTYVNVEAEVGTALSMARLICARGN